MTAPASSRPSAILWAATGAFAFLLINLLLLLGRCSLNELMINCNSGNDTTAVLVIWASVLAAAAFTRPGRGFAMGFFGMLVGLTVVSAGGCTVSWLDPAAEIKRATQPQDGPFRFDLQATGGPGMPNYLASADGDVHVTIEPRAAAIGDPLASR